MNKRISKKDIEPTVTILIAAYNEERHIAQTVKNKLELDYPSEKLEIIVISDCSEDKTDDIVNQFEGQGVRLLRQVPRAGKTSALNMAIPQAKGEILVFSDANSIYAPGALKALLANFSDDAVGYVTGKMIYVNPDDTMVGDGCSSYMKYENFLRKHETKIGSVVGVDGGIDAVRKELFRPMNDDQLPDFVLPLSVAQQGYRVVYEPCAILQEASLKKSRDEYKMRVRVALRALWALSDMRDLLTFGRNFLFSWQLWSHKVLRYLGFFFLIGAYWSNFLLIESGLFFEVVFILHNCIYFGALVCHLFERMGFDFKLLKLLNYFVLLNVASSHAFIKFLFRQKQVIWSPRKG